MPWACILSNSQEGVTSICKDIFSKIFYTLNAFWKIATNFWNSRIQTYCVTYIHAKHVAFFWKIHPPKMHYDKKQEVDSDHEPHVQRNGRNRNSRFIQFSQEGKFHGLIQRRCSCKAVSRLLFAPNLSGEITRSVWTAALWIGESQKYFKRLKYLHFTPQVCKGLYAPNEKQSRLFFRATM